jgi:Tat protein translocase TatB subunit
MFYLFILESIGTSELLLIGLVALIVFGPRKLPEFARMLGKARNEFRRTTDDFKQTWAREVDFESEEKQINQSNVPVKENSIQRINSAMKNEIVAPEIKEVSQADFQESIAVKEIETSDQTEGNLTTDKRNWL